MLTMLAPIIAQVYVDSATTASVIRPAKLTDGKCVAVQVLTAPEVLLHLHVLGDS